MDSRCIPVAIALVAGVALGHAAPAPLPTVVSIAPLQHMAEQVGGTLVSVSAFVAENQDPHTFSPSPRAVTALRECRLFLAAGLPFEASLVGKIQAMHPGLDVVDVSRALPARLGGGAPDRAAPEAPHGHEHAEGDAHQDGHGHGEHAEGDAHQGGHGHGHGEDPHVWLSLRNLSSMAAIVAEALTRHLPEHGDVIARNLAAYRSSLGRLDAEFARRLGPLRGQAFYIYHPALGHFAADYGLVQRPVEIEGKSPSPRQLAALVERARAEGVRVVFVQPQFQQRPAQILAERIGGRVVPLNPMASDPLAELRLAVDTLCPNQDKTGD